KPLIISGGEDKMVRVWEQEPGQPRWHERYQLDHQSIVKAVACTGPGAGRDLLVTRTASGRGRLFDLASLAGGGRMLDGRHTQAINCVAFSKDGKICVTGGEDRAIQVWDVDSGKLLQRIGEAHRAGVTALQFVPDGRLLSVGDRRLLLWDLGEDGKK